MINSNLLKKICALAAVGVLSASVVGCGNVKDKSAVTPKESVSTESTSTSDDSAASTKTALTEKDISPFIKGMEDMTVAEGTKDFDPLSSVTVDKNIIKGINADTSDADFNKVGKYTVTYNVVVNDEEYEAYKQDSSSHKEDFAKATSLTKVDASDTSVAVKKNLTVTAKDNKTTETKTDSKTDTTTKTDSKTSGTTQTGGSSTSGTTKTDTSTTTSGTSGTTGTTKQNTGSSGTTKQNTGTSGGTQSSGSSSGTTTKPTHTHNWVAQTKVVHHNAEYTTQWVQDSAAWDEPVYEEEPVYTEVEKVRCNGCGAEFDRIEEMDEHCWYYLDNYDDFSHGGYSVVWYNVQTGTQKVQTGTIHHEATGHNEQVLTKAAYDETVTTGYKCSGCGATK